MANIDIFRNDAFSMTSMLDPVDKLSYSPQLLGSLPGLFMPKPVRTTEVWIESRSDGPALIQTTERGTPPKNKDMTRRDARNFRTFRLALGDRILAHEIQNIRSFGSDSELKAVQEEVAFRQQRIKNDHELTKENWRLGVVTQAKLFDADGSIKYDWATEFGQALPAEMPWNLQAATPASGAVRKLCNTVTRGTMRALKGLGGTNVRIAGLCGDQFWDDLTAHSEVRSTYLNWNAAPELRTGNAWGAMPFGGIDWINYRGTDDNTTVAIATDKAKFFPLNAGIFQMALSPGEAMGMANTLGREYYPLVVPDKDRDEWVDVELKSYPLAVCTMPSALYSGRNLT